MTDPRPREPKGARGCSSSRLRPVAPRTNMSNVPPVREYDYWVLAAQIAAALATVFVGYLAIEADRIRAWWHGPKLTLAKHDNFRFAASEGGKRAHFLLLRVENAPKRTSAINCRVILYRIMRQIGNGPFVEEPVPVPLQLRWSPYPNAPQLTTVTSSQVLDLGAFVETENSFRPFFYFYPNNFKATSGGGERIQYHIEVSADNFRTAYRTIIEVWWNGIWTPIPEQMAKNVELKIFEEV